MTPSTLNLPATQEASKKLLVVVAVVWACVFFFAKHDSHISLHEHLSYSFDETENLLQKGHWQRPLYFSVFGIFGAYCLFHKPGQAPQFDTPLAISVTILVLWCAASIVWADDPGLTTRRLGVLVLTLIGTAGLARKFSLRQISILVVAVLTIYCTIGLTSEIVLGTFRPGESGYQFAGTVHPNNQAINCAALCLTAACLLTDHRTRHRLLYTILIVFALVLLLLTRSRTGIASLIPALGVTLIPRVPRRFRLLAGVGFAWIFCMVLLLATIADMPMASRLTNLVLMGRSGSTSTLQGRIPLWSVLMDYVQQRPLIGYGYHGFWNVEHIRAIDRLTNWAPSTAHSVYFDTVIGIGLIGLLLLLLTVAQAIYQLAKRFFRSRDGGAAFFLGLLVYAAFDGLLESAFVDPVFITVIAATGVMQMAFFRKEPQ